MIPAAASRYVVQFSIYGQGSSPSDTLLFHAEARFIYGQGFIHGQGYGARHRARLLSLLSTGRFHPWMGIRF